MRKDSVVYDKAFNFSIEIVKSYKHLKNNKNEYVMSKQLMKSGTGIGANISEALEAQSRNDFIHKLQVALKEANESRYWIDLLRATEYLSKEYKEKLKNKLKEIIKILVKIIKTCKEKKN